MNPPDLPEGWYWDFQIEGKVSYNDGWNLWVKAVKADGDKNDNCAYCLSLYPNDDVNAAFGKAYRVVLEMVLGYPWGKENQEDTEMQIQEHLRAIKASRDASKEQHGK